MTTTYKNEVITLPEWCKFWSDEEINAAAKAVYEDNHSESIEEIESEIEINCDQIIEELRDDGFTKSQIEEIVAYVECGYTINAAIQRIF